MAERRALRSVDQLAFDEVVIQDDDLEHALDHRLVKKVVLDKVRKEYDDADKAAKALIEQQELPDGGAIRVGRFRITRNTVSARSVSFEAKAASRLRITVLGEDQ